MQVRMIIILVRTVYATQYHDYAKDFGFTPNMNHYGKLVVPGFKEQNLRHSCCPPPQPNKKTSCGTKKNLPPFRHT